MYTALLFLSLLAYVGDCFQNPGTLQDDIGNFARRSLETQQTGHGARDGRYEHSTPPQAVPRGAPRNADATPISSRSAKLTWSPPMEELRNGKIIMYEIVYSKKSDDVLDIQDVKTPETTLVIDDLDADTGYVAQFRAYNSAGSGPWSYKLPFRTLQEDGPPPPSNIQLHILPSAVMHSTVMHVEWDPPVDHDVITGYRVYYSTSDEPDMDKWFAVEFHGPIHAVKIGGLRQGVVYYVRVRSLAQYDRVGPFSDVTSTVGEEQPMMVQGFSAVTHNPRSVKLVWRPPTNGYVARYKIDYEGIKTFTDQNGVKRTLVDELKYKMLSARTTTVYIEHLRPKTVYTFNISAKFEDGQWGGINSFTMETSADVPSAPYGLTASALSPRSIHLTWRSGKFEPVQWYILQYRPKHAPTSSYYDIGGITTTEYTVEDLAIYSQYEFRVAAVNAMGRGPPSYPTDATTAESVPGTPPANVSVTPVGAHTAAVRWTEPRIPNGVIRGYKVFYTSHYELPIHLWHILQVDAASLETNITELVPGKRYGVSVLAFTSAGIGPMSRLTFVTL